MILLIIVFGALTLLAGLIIILNPELIFGYLRNNLERPLLQVIAVTVRIVIGLLLITQASVSRYPLAIEILGWLSIVAAFTFAVMGRRNFKQLMTWALSLLKPFGRVGGIFVAAFGAFLIYAFI